MLTKEIRFDQYAFLSSFFGPFLSPFFSRSPFLSFFIPMNNQKTSQPPDTICVWEDRNYQATPPAPPKGQRVHRGMIGYEQRKRHERSQADLDRDASSRLHQQKVALATPLIVGYLAKTFPHLDVNEIAASITPWDPQLFKERVADRQREFLGES